MNSSAKHKSSGINDIQASQGLDLQHPTITLFVYGTLKRGFWNHDRFCRNAIDIRSASTWGRLYQLPAGYPALEIPESAILAHGTANPFADAATQARFTDTIYSTAVQHRPSGNWDQIYGELITFPDPLRDLPPIDRLEGFRPGMESLYRRELVWVQTQSGAAIAWLYSAGNVLGSFKSLRIVEFT
jgi:gamma-glutamylcyclotransferase (GGCT)/AIG2-like uncharacterized protein YtfP